MEKQREAPYGSWKSPITAELIVSKTIGFMEIKTDGDDVYWVEMRPAEQGRSIVVRRTPDGHVSDITSPPFSARTLVHEYGGGALAVADGTVYASNFADQRLYRFTPGAPPQPITPEVNMCYADGIVDRFRKRFICVREDHTDPEKEAVNTLISINLDRENDVQILVSGNDFYSSPRLSPDGSRLAWLTWNHPNMPWDGTELWVGTINDDGSLTQVKMVAGGKNESIVQPEWSPEGQLYFISDRTDWWNLYRWGEEHIEPVVQMEAEFGYPQWSLGLSSYTFASPDRIVCSFTRQGIYHLAIVDTTAGELETIETPYTEIFFFRTLPGHVVFVVGSFDKNGAIVKFNLATRKFEELVRIGDLNIDPRYFSKPEAIEFPTENDQTSHGFYYPPHNPDFIATHDELPPLVVFSHGGPTGATKTYFRPGIQYFTSRGIAVLDINYGGSTGYGRAYRQRLNGQWGVVDVVDCINGAHYLVERGLADGNRLAIRGGSAGGYTTLCALTFHNVFKAGASYYGISDLEALAQDTHKFESRYLDQMVGPYPEQQKLYWERSPIHFVDQLSCPMIILQGLEDKVVPPNQAEKMVEALRAKGLPVAYLSFPGEQHGFRQAENVKRAMEAEVYFYSQVFGFKLADSIEPVLIENL
ncbi:MAG: S9 family peptidase [Ardenticatenaceae bacterium]|nr:S9 family peptidase [Ardenticatenaceae bacterium]